MEDRWLQYVYVQDTTDTDCDYAPDRAEMVAVEDTTLFAVVAVAVHGAGGTDAEKEE